MREAFRNAYTRTRIPLSYALVALALLPQFAPVPAGVAIAAIYSLGFIVLTSIFSIQDSLRRQNPEARFTEFYDVATEIRDAASTRAVRRGVEIQALGMSMGHAWTFLSSLLSSLAKDRNVRNVRVQVAMLDPEWEQIAAFNPTWPERTRTQRQAILEHFTSNSELTNRRNWEFELRLYRHTPNWHGICLDGEILFLSTCSWQNGRLVGGENEYERFQRGGGPRADRAFELFQTWFGSMDGHVVYHDIRVS
jgi:hypothetical protein